MKVCIISNKIFRYGRPDGYGMLTYQIAKGLAQRGQEVYVVMNKYSDEQKVFDKFDGIKVIALPLGGKICLRLVIYLRL